MTETNTFYREAYKAGAKAQSLFVLIIVAAGSGSRLGYGKPKAEVMISGKEILRWALEGAEAAGMISKLIVTVPAGDTRLTAIAHEFGAKVVTGGATRADSVARALTAIRRDSWRGSIAQNFDDESEPTAVLVHDCARCFTPVEVFERVCRALTEGEKAVIPAVEVVDTIKTVDTDGYVKGTPVRSRLRAVQTPQGFDLETLRDAYVKATKMGLAEDITDDAMLAETLGIPVKVVAGSPHSFKITTPFDLAVAQTLCEKE